MASRHRAGGSISAHSTQRPDSRASTTSMVSQQHDTSTAVPALAPKPTYHASMPGDAEAALLQYNATLGSNVIQQYDMMSQHPDMAQHHAQSAPLPLQRGYINHEAQFWGDEGAQTAHARPSSVPFHAAHDSHDDKRKRISAVTATNDRELREMLAKNECRPLREVAQEVIQKERTPMAEKTKQLFAMLWLRSVCKPAKTSVPRNRVYSQYASRCGTERVIPLNPASFGKLVRVIFPGIQTRRLGVRGESKYHYVDLALEEDHPNIQPVYGSQNAQNFDQQSRPVSVNGQQIDFNTMPRPQIDTAVFPALDTTFDMRPASAPLTTQAPSSDSRAFAYPDTQGMRPGTAETLTYAQTLRFPAGAIPAFSENEPVTLPSIRPYLPPRTDQDSSEALFALYRTHCTSLIDSIRFCKEKQFFRLYTSFQGTLTVPVQKLFVHPNLAPWIEQCDLVMYRTMVRFVSRLTLQAAPVIVINILGNISANLHAHIAKTFSVLPAHVLEAKLRPATVFASLLHRLIRVNQSAHAAANLLTIDQNREQMWREWVTMVNPKRVMEAELPNCGYEKVYQILTTEMRGLLEPLQSPAFRDDPYAISPYSFDDNGAFASFLSGSTTQPNSRSGPSAVSTETVLDRWSAFITSLPGRFPNAPARTLLHCVSAVGTAALRDITIMNGLSFGHWWVLKIFVDEMALWMAEMGGFLEPTQHHMSADDGGPFHSPVMESNQDQQDSRFSSMGPDTNTNNGGNPTHQVYQIQNTQPSGFSTLYQNAAMGKPHHLHETDIDDSGIGMSLLDDEIAKFGVVVANDAVGAGGMQMNTG